MLPLVVRWITQASQQSIPSGLDRSSLERLVTQNCACNGSFISLSFLYRHITAQTAFLLHLFNFLDDLQVANPHDILLFTKAPKRRTNAEGLVLFCYTEHCVSSQRPSLFANIW